MTVYTISKIPVQLEDKPLAAPGGEGAVYRVRTSGAYDGLCAKIYHLPKRTPVRKNKIDFMIRNKPQVLSSSSYVICWPTEMIFDQKGQFIGFLMPLAFAGSEKLYELTTIRIPKRLELQWSKFDRTLQSGIEKRMKVCVNIAIAIHSIHQSGKYVVVDYKPQNILITPEGKVSITDVDSFQISENGVVLFYAEVATPEYAPVESARINPSRSLVSESWDSFSLAVSFYEILFGIHPFSATCDGQYQAANTIGEKIQKGLFVHGSKKNYLTVIPPIHNNFNLLPASLSQLFIKAFEDGHTASHVRPNAEVWGKTIHNELINKTGIKAHTVTVPSPNRPVKATTPPVTTPTAHQPVTNPQKDDYMIWKILAAILLIALIITCAVLIANSAELEKLRSSLNDWEQEKSSLQRQLTELQNAQSSEKQAAEAKVQELQTILDDIVDKYPLTVTDITFNNAEYSGTKLNTETHYFDRNNLQYVHPVIKFNSNLRVANRYYIYYKYFDPEGTLRTASNSPVGYTWYANVLIYGNFSKNNTAELNGFRFGGPESPLGRYRVEIWCKDVLVGESFFVVTGY